MRLAMEHYKSFCRLFIAVFLTPPKGWRVRARRAGLLLCVDFQVEASTRIQLDIKESGIAFRHIGKVAAHAARAEGGLRGQLEQSEPSRSAFRYQRRAKVNPIMPNDSAY